MKLFFLLITALFQLSGGSEKVCFSQSTSNPTPCYPDYYWRDYTGVIPEDALEGGQSASGKPFYVGQAYFRYNELLPATIFPGKSHALASAYSKELKTNTHVKILCSIHKNNFKWLSIESKNLHRITNNSHIVIGGSEVGQVLYIGRVFDQTSVTLGKIFKDSLGNRGIWVPSNGHEANYLSYDILTYSCQDESVNGPGIE